MFTLELIQGGNKKKKRRKKTREQKKMKWGGEGYKGLEAERMKGRENTRNHAFKRINRNRGKRNHTQNSTSTTANGSPTVVP